MDRRSFLAACEDAIDKEACDCIALRIEQVEHLWMPLAKRDLMRIGIEREGPLINGAALATAKRRELRCLADSVRRAARIGGDQFFRKAHVTQGRSHENIR